MRRSVAVLAIASLVSFAYGQADTVAYTDTETGITFQSYTDNETQVSWRVALPEEIDGDYDALVQIEGPAALGWIGWAWAGTMAYNPLTVVWANANEVIHSSRIAYGFYTPSIYNGTTYQILKGTGVNGTNFKFTAVCKGCTIWKDYDGNQQTLDFSQPARLAFASSHTAVDTPSDSNSNFEIHDYVGHWYADLTAAKSTDFSSWVLKNTDTTGNGTAHQWGRANRQMK
ncbi:cellobiose dehydrogenase [Seiridium cupressi]